MQTDEGVEEHVAAQSWARYRAWNEAIADYLFSDSSAGRAVYLAIEDDDLAHLCRILGEPDDQSSAPLVEAVKATLNLEPGVNDFRDHVQYVGARAGGSLDTPSSLALLVVLSLAAASMDAADGMAAHNYYGRLTRLLGITDPDTIRRLESGYQHVAEDLWTPLNDWLVAWDGARGVPTAYPVGQRYIGLPMSQALVRRRDRNALHRIFGVEGLPPGYRIGTSDMERIIENWAARAMSPLSHPFRALWASPVARERMTAIATLELETWDGRGGALDPSATGSSRAGGVRLTATFRSFPRSHVELSLAVPIETADGAATLLAEGPNGPTPVLVIGGPGGVSNLANPGDFDPDSLLADEISLHEPDSDRRFHRFPRTAVVLRADGLQGNYVETGRSQLGEKCIVLVAGSLAERAREVLRLVARPGCREVPPGTPGLPAGWVMFRDVEILARYEGPLHADLTVLQPLAGATLSISGGFQMPGHLRKWSSLEPPEIQGIVESAGSVRVRVDRGDRIGQPVLDRSFSSNIALVLLSSGELADGEYLVTLYADAGNRPVATSVLRLRSSDSVAAEAAGEVGSVRHVPTLQGPTWAVSAVVIAPTDGGTGHSVCGLAQMAGIEPEIDQPRPPQTASVTPAALDRRKVTQHLGMPPARSRPRPVVVPVARPVLRMGRGLGDASCMKTLAHRFELPDDRPDAPKSTFIESACVNCGLEKRFPTRGRQKKAPQSRTNAPLLIASLPPATSTDVEIAATVAFDTLCHLGGGPSSALDKVAVQVDSSALYGDRLLRALEVAGHIDVVRAADGRPLHWAMTPSTVVPLQSGDAWLVGWRSRSMVGQLRAAAELWGGSVREDLDVGIPRVTLTGVDGTLLRDVLSDAQLGDRTPVVGSVSPLALLHALPRVSKVGRGLQRSPLPGVERASRWDTASATWVSTATVADPGAYRLQGVTTRYGYRSRRDVLEGTIAFAGVHLVKHLASAAAGDPLPGYHAESASVVVPLGADLPGLYGRALVACSGRQPLVREKSRLLQYTEVPRAVADALANRLRS